MARTLSQTLIRLPSLSRSLNLFPSSSSRFVNHRSNSQKAQLIEVDLEPAGGDSEVEILGLRRLEDAIHGIIVRRSAPDWLPFIPGSSYWVPPRKRPTGFVELFEKLANPLTQEENLSLSSARGFPCSSYFVDGASPYPVEMELNSGNASHSEDEEG
ncbi:hypothetical protein ACHQM5_030434 [Ranunculus cassubicifolius]